MSTADLLIPIFKFIALLISAFFAGLALFVQFNENGKITKWGRIAVKAIIISFIISVTLEGLDVYRRNEDAARDREKTQKLLNEISRSLYAVNSNDIFFDLSGYIDFKSLKVRGQLSKLSQLDSVISLLKGKSKNQFTLPRGTKPLLRDAKLIGLEIDSSSVFYPDENTDDLLYKLIGNASLNISICKSDSLTPSMCNPFTASLFFETTFSKTVISYIPDSILKFQAIGLRPKNDDFVINNKGVFESLPDFANANISFHQSDEILSDLRDSTFALANLYHITSLDVRILGKKFSSFEFCIKPYPVPQYSFRFPPDLSKSTFGIKCKDENNISKKQRNGG